MPTYRIGIDVGGTFTHAVALDAASFELIAQAKVPTTHYAERGVSEGVVQALQTLLADSGLAPSDIVFVAYSTTQITNALLEGDAAPVGIVAIAAGLEGKRAAAETRLGDLELAPGRSCTPPHRARGREGEEAARRGRVGAARRGGRGHRRGGSVLGGRSRRGNAQVMEVAQALGAPATGTHEISGRYGLRVRTRTAVINASLLPKTIATADMTEQAVRESGLTAPLMVVRSDGGRDERHRPAPPSPAQPALRPRRGRGGGAHVSAGERGRLPRGGRHQHRHHRHAARTGAGAHRGGGRASPLPQHARCAHDRRSPAAPCRGCGAQSIVDVGPRSAHLAQLPYACFSEPAALQTEGRPPALVQLSPLPGDPEDYVALEVGEGKHVAVTMTCAANVAGPGAGGRLVSWQPGGGAPRAGRAGHDAEAVGGGRGAGACWRVAAEKTARTVQDAARRARHECGDDGADRRRRRRLRAGARGRRRSWACRCASPRTTRWSRPSAPRSPWSGTWSSAPCRRRRSRTCCRSVGRRSEAAVRAGADPESVNVEVEYDARTAVLRATASGQVELRARDLAQAAATDEERQRGGGEVTACPRRAGRFGGGEPRCSRAYQTVREQRRLLGLFAQRETVLAVVDHQGVTRLLLRKADGPRGGGERRPARACSSSWRSSPSTGTRGRNCRSCSWECAPGS